MTRIKKTNKTSQTFTGRELRTPSGCQLSLYFNYQCFLVEHQALCDAMGESVKEIGIKAFNGLVTVHQLRYVIWRNDLLTNARWAQLASSLNESIIARLRWAAIKLICAETPEAQDEFDLYQQGNPVTKVAAMLLQMYPGYVPDLNDRITATMHTWLAEPAVLYWLTNSMVDGMAVGKHDYRELPLVCSHLPPIKKTQTKYAVSPQEYAAVLAARSKQGAPV